MTLRGIGVAASLAVAAIGIAACTPPMPPDVLAARAEAQIQCRSGETAVSVPEAFAGSMSAVGLALGGVCPDQTVLEVPAGDAAPVALIDRAPSDADVQAFARDSCPAGSPVVVPAFAYPVTLAYNVVGLEGVVMTPQIVAGILNGTITSWEDPLIVAANPDYDFSGLPELSVVGVEGPSGSVAAMTTWLDEQAPESWTLGPVDVIPGAQAFPTSMDMLGEMTAMESTVSVMPVFQALGNVLASASLPAVAADGSEVIVTADDVQLAKVGSGATTVRADSAGGSLLAGPAIGGVPVEGNFDVAASKIVLGEGQPLVGWPVNGYAHLLVCDAPDDPLPLAFAQYLVRLAGQGALETFGVTPLPEPIRIATFAPLKVTVNTDGE